MRSLPKTLALLIALLALFSITGFGSTITQSETLTNAIFVDDPLNPGTGYFSVSLATISKFNTTLGTLTSISFIFGQSYAHISGTITAGSGGSASLVFQNVTDTVSLRDAKTPTYETVNLTKKGPANSSTYTAPAGQTISFDYGSVPAQSLSLPTRTATYNGSGTRTAYNGTASDLPTSIDISLFKGTGLAALTVYGTSTVTVGWSPSSGSSYTSKNYISETVTVNYDYTPAPPPSVPEPLTLTMFGAGLVAIGWIGRRCRK